MALLACLLFLTWLYHQLLGLTLDAANDEARLTGLFPTERQANMIYAYLRGVGKLWFHCIGQDTVLLALRFVALALLAEHRSARWLLYGLSACGLAVLLIANNFWLVASCNTIWAMMFSRVVLHRVELREITPVRSLSLESGILW